MHFIIKYSNISYLDIFQYFCFITWPFITANPKPCVERKYQWNKTSVAVQVQQIRWHCSMMNRTAAKVKQYCYISILYREGEIDAQRWWHCHDRSAAQLIMRKGFIKPPVILSSLTCAVFSLTFSSNVWLIKLNYSPGFTSLYRASL